MSEEKKLTTNRWPLYVPNEYIDRFNQISVYVRERDISMSGLIRNLLEAFMRNEGEEKWEK